MDESVGDAADATAVDVVVAGHICLDIIPKLGNQLKRPDDLFVPGGLVHVGPATLALGGCVANTGLALHRLGARTRLVGKIGDDLLGKAILESLRDHGTKHVESMIVAHDEATSYTIVFSPPGIDRGFLHCSGANDTFSAGDLHASSWNGARILHFGYPPLMRAIARSGKELAQRFAAVQDAGALVTLDMAMPATGSESAPVDWPGWLAEVLPNVDVFLPSYDELGMLLADSSSPCAASTVVDVNRLATYSTKLLNLGVPIVIIKLGDQGLYLRTGEGVAALSRRKRWREFDWQPWRNRELIAPCFEVEVVGTTGSGDCTIAGLLMALLQGAGPEQALRFATAVGAHCVESADATSGIPARCQIDTRLQLAWQQRVPTMSLTGWQFLRDRGVYVAPVAG